MIPFAVKRMQICDDLPSSNSSGAALAIEMPSGNPGRPLPPPLAGTALEIANNSATLRQLANQRPQSAIVARSPTTHWQGVARENQSDRGQAYARAIRPGARSHRTTHAISPYKCPAEANILAGNQPSSLTAARLRTGPVPLSWQEQRALLFEP